MITDSPYKRILRVVLRENVSLTEGWFAPLEAFIASLEPDESKPEDRREANRQAVELAAIIRLQKKGNEVIYLPAKMKNISTTGVMLEVLDKGHIIAEAAGEIEQFMVSFQVPGTTEPLTLECHPKRLEFNHLIGVGAEFASVGSSPQRFVM